MKNLHAPSPLASYPCSSYFSCHCRFLIKSLCCCLAEATFLWKIYLAPVLYLYSHASTKWQRKIYKLRKNGAMTGFLPPLAKGKKNYKWKESEDTKEEGKRESQEFSILYHLPFSSLQKLSAPFSSSAGHQTSFPSCYLWSWLTQELPTIVNLIFHFSFLKF